MKQQETYRMGGINGAALKWLAIITMTIDHVGVGLIGPYNRLSVGYFSEMYLYTRLIGRLAFPIFVFLIVQGYQHTSNLRKYLIQLLTFAFISEVPFDRMSSGQLVNMNHQNIFFTLFLGVAGLTAWEYLEKKGQSIIQFLQLVLVIILAERLNVDYGWYGILFIFGVGILRDNKINQTLFGVVMGFTQMLTASLSFLPIWYYNGERGKQNKWFFYLYYPVHLFIIYLIRQWFIV